MQDKFIDLIMPGLYVVLGALLSYIQNLISRKWTKDDYDHQRRKEIIDFRATQIETYLENITEDIRGIYDSIKSISWTTLFTEEVKREDYSFLAEIIGNSRNLVANLYFYTPSIEALGNDDLLKAWTQVLSSRDKLHGYLQDFSKIIKKSHREKQNPEEETIEELIIRMDEIWKEYAKNVGEFKSRLDLHRIDYVTNG